MALVCKPESPANISLLDGQPPLVIDMINDLRPHVNKAKEEVIQYIEPATPQNSRNARVLKTITENAHGNRVSRTDHASCDNSCTPPVKEIPLGRKKRSDMRPPGNHATTRMDNSLLVTTRKFILLKSENNVVNLNEAAVLLNVPKRRLYDITNVLEGVDLVEKVGKNSIRWKTDDGDTGHLRELQSQCRSLTKQEKELDEVITDLSSAVKIMKEDPTDMPHGYVRLEELRKLSKFSNQTLILIKSHPGAPCTVETQLRHDSLSDLITPDKVMFQGSGAFLSPLKMLLDPYAQFPNNIETDSSNILLTPDATDLDAYSFPSSGLSLNDLFSSSDWELPQSEMVVGKLRENTGNSAYRSRAKSLAKQVSRRPDCESFDSLFLINRRFCRFILESSIVVYICTMFRLHWFEFALVIAQVFLLRSYHVGELLCRNCGASITRQSELLNITASERHYKYKYDFPVVGKNTTIHVFENPAGFPLYVLKIKIGLNLMKLPVVNSAFTHVPLRDYHLHLPFKFWNSTCCNLICGNIRLFVKS
uniref:E2F_TDP domain-containing protein n=1 Tax=Angiostrongylus cantonensis TaxID=6313 RepID=A0A0K0DPJ2_ANGCA